MKIAFNTITVNPYQPSGAQGYYINVLKEMDKLLDRDIMYLFVSKANTDLYSGYSKNIKKILFPFSGEKRILRILTELLWFPVVLRKYNISVINTGNVLPLYVPCKSVMTIKTMHAYTHPRSLDRKVVFYRKLMNKNSARRCDKIIANSTSCKSDIIKYLGVPESKISIVYEALDHRIFKPAGNKISIIEGVKSFGIFRPFILFVSSLWRYKNAEALIRAYKIHYDRLKNFDLVFVGFVEDLDYKSELDNLIESLQIENNCHFIGGVSQETLAVFYQAAEVFVYPSFNETFGLTILESMACGCPVVASDVGSISEIAGGAALLFDPNQPDMLGELLARVLNNKVLRGQTIEKGLLRASEFNWIKTARQTLDILRQVNVSTLIR